MDEIVETRGRRSRLTPEVEAKIIEAIEIGASYKHAAEYAGIAPKTLYNWMSDDQEFGERIRAHEGKSAVYLLALLNRAAEQDWHAAAWKLEHRWAEDYAKSRIDVHHSGDVKVSVDLLATLRMVVEQVFPNDLEAQERLADALQVVEAAPPQLPNVRPRGPRAIARERRERAEGEENG